MKITQDIRDQMAMMEAGMAAKSAEFLQGGGSFTFHHKGEYEAKVLRLAKDSL